MQAGGGGRSEDIVGVFIQIYALVNVRLMLVWREMYE